jgi:hypothetical protein
LLYWAGLVELLILHFVLCYPAAICRGHPPLEPFWLVAMYVAFPCVGLLPAFDDFRYAPRARHVSLAVFCAASSMILGTAGANLSDARPHTGHLVGYLGLVRDRWPEILLESIARLTLVLPFIFWWESVCRGLWDHVRRFASPGPASVRVADLLLIVGSIGLLCGLLRVVVGLGPDDFSRPLVSD